jgi:predicted component of viral defense system (DUF524 family)
MRSEIKEKTFDLEDGAKLTLLPIGDKAKIFEISDDEAAEFGEAHIQILESKQYEYEIEGDEICQLHASTNNCVTPSKTRKSNRGTLSPGNYVGTLKLWVTDSSTPFYLEVLATKFHSSEDFDISYRQNYRKMLEDITEKCSDLLMQPNSPINQYFEPDFDRKNKTIYQRFSFVKGVLDSPEFDEALHQILSNPKSAWEIYSDETDIRSIKKFTNKSIKEVLTRSSRVPVNKKHSLSVNHNLNSLPTRIHSSKQKETLDNPENRFVKYALVTIRTFCEDCREAFGSDSLDYKDADRITQKLDGYLSHSIFSEIGQASLLKLNSPTLQRKAGYREIFKTWLLFELAAKLTWHGGDDVYYSGKRDIASLYEYWLFFQLYDLFQQKFRLNKIEHEGESYAHLFETTKYGLNLILKQGKHTALEGDFEKKNRNLTVKFSFNRSFQGGNLYQDKKAGSYSTTLRPDYTLSIWPRLFSEKEAEEKELIVHIHFDAKYKVAQFTYNTSTDSEVLDLEKQQERRGKFKNADLLKMHAYKDAIRRTGGAYILYPGTEGDPIRGFHEVIPGLGAFTVNPGFTNNGLTKLSLFIDQVIDHLLDRTSQREKVAYKSHLVHQEQKLDDNLLHEALPEYINQKKLFPDETFVLVGYYSSPEQYKWFKTNGVYNLRMDAERGSLELDLKILSAQFLLLHTLGETTSGDLWEIIGAGPKIWSKTTMKNKSYPNKNVKDNYLIFKIRPVAYPEFKTIKWDFRKLSNYSSGRASAFPFTASLTELMRTKVE